MNTLYKKITAKLNDHFPLPKTGIVAGQAVAQAYFDALDIDITTRYKDLDYFVKTNESNTRLGLMRGTETEISSKWCSGAGEVLEVLDKAGYLIVLADYNIDTKINRVEIEFSGEESVMTILQGFDINSCAIGLDLDTEEVVIHPAFLDFVNSRELKLTSIHTPISSFIRMLQKTQYINATLNMDKLVKQVSLAIQLRCDNPLLDDHFFQGTGITQGRYNFLDDRTKSLLAIHFDFESKDYIFSAKGTGDDEIVSAVVFNPKVKSHLMDILPDNISCSLLKPYRNDLGVINSIIENKLDIQIKHFLSLLTSNYALSNIKDKEHMVIPWVFNEWVKGAKLKEELFNINTVYFVLEDFWLSSWLWEDSTPCEFEMFTSFVLFQKALGKKGISMHLLRELKPYISAGITDHDFINKALENLVSTIKAPSNKHYQSEFKIYKPLGRYYEIITSWDTLVKRHPKSSEVRLNYIWDQICNGDLVVVMNHYSNNENIFINVDNARRIACREHVVLLNSPWNCLLNNIKKLPLICKKSFNNLTRKYNVMLERYTGKAIVSKIDSIEDCPF
jgi:hypothetical protein